jgi:predicted nuclease with TOPRIM domain
VLSLVQSASVRAHDHQAAANAANATELSQAQRDSIVELLSKEGIRLKSQPISMLAMKLAGDPFAKVKDLIQNLIERLLKESIGEATKEGFCNTELGKAEKDRDFRYQEVKTLNVEIASLELKKDELESEIQELTDSIETLWEDLNTSTTLRGEEHDINMDTLAKAKSGLTAITEAIVILKAFYAKGAKAVSLAQASPVDEDTSGPGFTGSYGGKQVASKGIIGMLAVIKTDFERTIQMTSDAEKKAQAEFVEFDRVSRTDISGKDTKKTLDEEDLRSTVAAIAEGMSKLQTEMSLLDSALKRLFELKPMCTDFGMSYADRVAKREEEIDALKRAICALGGECPP